VKEANNDTVKELMPRYLAGHASPEEQNLLQDWINASAENERHYEDFKRIFELSEQHYIAHKKEAHALPINIDAEWQHFLNTISTPEKKNVRQLSSSPATWYKVAATVALLAVSAFILYHLYSPAENIRYQTAENTQSVTLPDGSVVTLNRHSELYYPVDFGKAKRTVTFSGEAFFSVAHDATKPFTIKVDDALVEVLGTSFNVRGYESDKAVEVVVKTGTVKLSVPTLHTEVELNAGEKGVYTDQSKNIDRGLNKDINFLAWNTRQIIFEESDLKSVIETLNKVYGVNIVLTTPTAASCIVTVTFDHQSLEAVLHVLENTLNLTYTIQGNQIEITGAGC